ncbi:pyrroline-5-carboxylate reductase [Pararhodospirillum oryzae]|uniref:Pyrroline-5-carboxylate reductase n=1 Tax=Pararhodospirillum oryzae TaxID=478448 RepID=A0A512H4H0_9PROT|nr:pyrroline-5-carboxylate reductase [Pararhodospirillum oryzae]
MGLRVLLLGCGRMGGSMLAGWLAQGLDPAAVAVVDPAAEVPPGVRRITQDEALALTPRPDICVVAVKPQMINSVLPAYGPLVAQGTVFLSIAAGITLAGIERMLNAPAAVVRAMPNTPAAIGRGMTVLCANPRVEAPARAACETLLSAVGAVDWVDDEALMDEVTALSGSGPAYVFLLVEAMAEAGRAAGLPPALAEKLARQTVAGSGALLDAQPDEPAALRRAVTSPGGTTAAALAVLMADDGLAPLMKRALEAAAHRSRELAS